MATDKSIHDRISALIGEEHDLRAKLERREITPDEEHKRLGEIEVALDQSWDLLRQRQAKRDAGLDPNDAATRPAGVVEKYLD